MRFAEYNTNTVLHLANIHITDTILYTATIMFCGVHYARVSVFRRDFVLYLLWGGGRTWAHSPMDSWAHGHILAHGHSGTWTDGPMGTWLHGHMGSWAHGVHGHMGTLAYGHMGHTGTLPIGHMGTGAHEKYNEA